MAASGPLDFLVDGRHYDALHDGRTADIPFFVHRAAPCSSVLELGCGTGRLSIPVAETGTAFVGVDLCASFLERARHKAAERSLQTLWHQDDVRTFSLQRCFELILFPFNAVAALLTEDDLDACFARVREHLAPRGSFILETFNADHRRGRQGSSTFCYSDPADRQSIRVQHDKHYDPSTGIETATFRFTPTGHTRTLALRLHTTQELLTALSKHGLQLTEHLGDHRGVPFDGTTPCQILVARMN